MTTSGSGLLTGDCGSISCKCQSQMMPCWGLCLTRTGVGAHTPVAINAGKHTLTPPFRLPPHCYSSWISRDPYPKGPQVPIQNQMSRHNDAGASYDRTLLSNIPNPTRAEKQVRCIHFFSIPSSRDWQFEHITPSLPYPSSVSLPRTPCSHLPCRYIGGLQHRFAG